MARFRAARKLQIVAALAAMTLVACGPTAPATYYRVALGDHRKAVLYKLGPPSTVLGPPETKGSYIGSRRGYTVDGPAGDQNSLPPGADFRSYHQWEWDHLVSGYVSVDFEGDGVSRVRCFGDDKNSSSCDALGGISPGTEESQVVAKLGKPTRSTLSESSKTLLYPGRHIEVTLSKEKVYMLALIAPTE